MPMQPKPNAETSRPLVPSVRVCIADLPWKWMYTVCAVNAALKTSALRDCCFFQQGIEVCATQQAAVEKYGIDAPAVANVLGRIRVEQNQVGALADCNRTGRCGDAKEFGGGQRRRAQR